MLGVEATPPQFSEPCWPPLTVWRREGGREEAVKESWKEAVGEGKMEWKTEVEMSESWKERVMRGEWWNFGLPSIFYSIHHHYITIYIHAT